MIKWDGFGKLLKLSFFGLLTSFFTLFVGSFASAGLQEIGIQSNPSSVNNQYNITFLKGGGILTNFLGYGKSVLALDSNVLFWWTPNGLPYIYTPFGQGFPSSVFSCDLLTPGNSPSNCSSLSITGNNDTYNMFKGFFSSVNLGDYAYYDYQNYFNQGTTCSVRKQYLTVCFNSNSINSSICFGYTPYCYYGCQGPTNAEYCSGLLDGGVVNSQNYENLTFSNLSQDSIGYAPGQNGYMGNYEGSSQGSSEVNNNNLFTGDYVYQVCSNGYVKNYLEGQGLSKYACYVGLDINNTGLQIATAGLGSSVFELFQATNGGNNFADWFTYWDTQYGNRLVLSSGAWSSNVGLYPYFQFVNEYAGQFTSSEIQDYCRIVVNDLSLTGKWTGSFKYCSSLSSSLGGPAGGSSSSWGDNPGDVPVGVNWGTGTENVDTITFIQNWFNKAKEVIPTDFSNIGGGILPTYIIMFLIALMLFRFVSH